MLDVRSRTESVESCPNAYLLPGSQEEAWEEVHKKKEFRTKCVIQGKKRPAGGRASRVPSHTQVVKAKVVPEWVTQPNRAERGHRAIQVEKERHTVNIANVLRGGRL